MLRPDFDAESDEDFLSWFSREVFEPFGFVICRAERTRLIVVVDVGSVPVTSHFGYTGEGAVGYWDGLADFLGRVDKGGRPSSVFDIFLPDLESDPSWPQEKIREHDATLARHGYFKKALRAMEPFLIGASSAAEAKLRLEAASC